MWVTSNITAGQLKEIDALMNEGLHKNLITNLSHEHVDVKRESCVAIGNIFVQGSEEHVEELIGNDFLEELSKIITPEQDARVL